MGLDRKFWSAARQPMSFWYVPGSNLMIHVTEFKIGILQSSLIEGKIVCLGLHLE